MIFFADLGRFEALSFEAAHSRSAAVSGVIHAERKRRSVADLAGLRSSSLACSGSGAGSFLANTDSNVAAAVASSVLGGNGNSVCDDEATVAGGALNVVNSQHDTGLYSVIAAGSENEIVASDSFIGAGFENKVISSQGSAVVAGTQNVVTSADLSFIGGGVANAITSAALAFIGGGSGNIITAVSHGVIESGGATGSAILGGGSNRISAIKTNGAQYSFIGGGYGNTITGDGEDAVIGGGEGNIATGTLSAIPGGFHNLAQGELSFAAGYFAVAATPGSFVWADFSPNAPHLTATRANQFLARATGGFTFYSNEALTTGASLAPGSGTWAAASDRNLKADVQSVDSSRLLYRLQYLPISQWSYISEPGISHIGPMAQDFFASFEVGEDDRHITSIDEAGVSLAALKALSSAVQEIAKSNNWLSGQINRLVAQAPHHGRQAARYLGGAGYQRREDASPCSGSGTNSFLANSQNNVAAGAQSSIGGGITNSVCDDDSAIIAGAQNELSSGDDVATQSLIAGGIDNTVTGTSSFIGTGNGNNEDGESAIVSGQQNSIVGGTFDMIGSGTLNKISLSGSSDIGSAIGGGSKNSLIAADASIIVGGEANSMFPLQAKEAGSFIGGGSNNQIRGSRNGPSATEVTIAGGHSNVASAQEAAIPGGYSNVVTGNSSFAAGYGSRANYPGSFLWADYSVSAPHLTSLRANQVLVRATGGVSLFTDTSQKTGVVLAPGSGTWASASDRLLKDRVEFVDPGSALRGLNALPISRWSYNSEPGVRHIGPMAQDFFSLFRVGEDNRHIATIDEDGVAMIAIKALNSEITALRSSTSTLGNRLAFFRQPPRRRVGSTARQATSCSGSGSNSFLASPDAGIVAAAQASVVSGSDNMVCDDNSTIGAGTDNVISTGTNGGQFSFIGSGSSNTVSSERSFLGSGVSESIADSPDSSLVIGYRDTLVQGSANTFMGGSFESSVTDAGAAVMLGGSGNSITGLNGNVAEANGAFDSALGGGAQNAISSQSQDGAEYAFLGGGEQNTVSGRMSVLFGGQSNTASGFLSSIPGGVANSATGELSFAAGSFAQASTLGSFVWGDNNIRSPITATAPNQFLMRASGGTIFYSNAAMNVGVTLAPGSGAWSSSSDRSLKTAVRSVSGAEILEGVLALPISKWSYRSELGVRHIGPMAQDFYATFKIGEDNRHIATIDEDGVVLAAVKQLAHELQEINARNFDLRRQVHNLQIEYNLSS